MNQSPKASASRSARGAENADNQRLQEILRMAEERCQLWYSMSHVIKVNAKIKSKMPP